MPVFDTEAFKRCREKNGLSQRTAAAIAGVAPATISRWESGKRIPSLDYIVAVAKALGIPLDLLLKPDTCRLRKK